MKTKVISLNSKRLFILCSLHSGSSSSRQVGSEHFVWKFFFIFLFSRTTKKLRWSLSLWESILIALYMCEQHKTLLLNENSVEIPRDCVRDDVAVVVNFSHHIHTPFCSPTIQITCGQKWSDKLQRFFNCIPFKNHKITYETYSALTQPTNHFFNVFLSMICKTCTNKCDHQNWILTPDVDALNSNQLKKTKLR